MSMGENQITEKCQKRMKGRLCVCIYVYVSVYTLNIKNIYSFYPQKTCPTFVLIHNPHQKYPS